MRVHTTLDNGFVGKQISLNGFYLNQSCRLLVGVGSRGEIADATILCSVSGSHTTALNGFK